MAAMAEPFDPAAYALDLDLPELGRRDLAFVCENEPGRVVRSGPLNSAGRTWSHKIGGAIQLESRTLERPYAVLLEYDDDVVSYFDQPPLKITFVHEDPEAAR